MAYRQLDLYELSIKWYLSKMRICISRKCCHIPLLYDPAIQLEVRVCLRGLEVVAMSLHNLYPVQVPVLISLRF